MTLVFKLSENGKLFFVISFKSIFLLSSLKVEERDVARNFMSIYDLSVLRILTFSTQFSLIILCKVHIKLIPAAFFSAAVEIISLCCLAVSPRILIVLLRDGIKTSINELFAFASNAVSKLLTCSISVFN